MTFAYLILAHKNPSQLQRLINTLDHEDVVIIVHLDPHIPIAPFLNKLNQSFKGQVFFVPRRKHIVWGKYSMIEATMSLIDFFFKLDLTADYIHLLSGQDYPVKSHERMQLFFSENEKKNYMEYFSLLDERWRNSLGRISYRWGVNREVNQKYSNLAYATNFDKVKKLPEGIRPYGGSQWWSLHYECLKYIYDEYREGSELFNFYRFTLVPDEMLFQTLLLNSPFSETIVNDNLRFIKWKKYCDHPEIVRYEDLDSLQSDDFLFARKFNFYDTSLFDELDKMIGHKKALSNETSSKYCVISAVGKNSLHRAWFDKSPQAYDLHLIVYDDSFETYKQDTPYVTRGKGQKLQLVYHYLMDHKDILDTYDYFFLPDDDIKMNEETIIKLFKTMEEYNLSIAQPALVNSYYTFPETLKQPSKVLRYTNFVEMMVPCFSRDALRKTLFTFIENKSGWGADWHWSPLVKSEKYNIAILDDVPIVHTRPIQSGSEENRKELSDYMRKYKLTRRVIQYT